MGPGLQAILALFPIALGGVLLVGLRVPAKHAMPAAYAAAVLVALFAWEMTVSRVAAASIQGLFLTFDLLFIIFGAILLLHTLERSGGVAASGVVGVVSTAVVVVATVEVVAARSTEKGGQVDSKYKRDALRLY